ncbi:CPBP family intramembrane glutamic endopeptidase [Glaciibacter sp. 2TAF33]|uniref:CPBP family intramembrane glutamic endopeptidase n=1 Tax=Glaciibacter sp. 2TAF33 TaxID=3233015 RepID=UPI003F8EBA12
MMAGTARSAPSSPVRSKRLGGAVAVFVGVAFGFSWLVWLPLAVAGRTTVMPWYFYLGSMGPALGAIMAAFVLRSADGVRVWLRRTFSLRGIRLALGVVLVSIVLYVGVGLLVEEVATGSIGRLTSVGLTTQLPGASAVLVAATWVVTFGLGEETGWRGWLMPVLTGRFGFVPAGLIVAGVWLVWHLPQFLFNIQFRAMGWATIGWAVALVAGSFWLGWLARLGRWSIVPVVLWHGGFDFLTSSDLGPSTFPATVSTIVMAQAAVVVVLILAGRTRARAFGVG